MPRSVLGHAGVQPGEALDVQLVDDRVGERRGGRAVVAPGEGAAQTTRARHERRRVGGSGGRDRPARRRGRPGPSAPRRRWRGHRGRAGAWPGCSAAPPRGPRGRARGSRSAALRRRPARSPPRRSPPRLRSGEPLLRAGLVEEAEVHPLGDAAEHGEVVPARRRAPRGAGRRWSTPARRDVVVTPPPRTRPRRMIRSATRPVQPVWCEAPSPEPLSPWKYSWKSSASRQRGVALEALEVAEHRAAPVARRGRKIADRRSARSIGDLLQGALLPRPAGNSTGSRRPGAGW